jgi:hypothetical protein
LGFIDNGGSFTTLSIGSQTLAFGINNSGDVVGRYQDSAGFHGFLYSGANYTTLDFPGGASGTTTAQGINASGQIVGSYSTLFVSNGVPGFLGHGFIYSAGSYVSFDVPSSIPLTSTFLAAVNDRGDIVGSYASDSGIRGFLYSGGVFTTLDDPWPRPPPMGALLKPGASTTPIR